MSRHPSLAVCVVTVSVALIPIVFAARELQNASPAPATSQVPGAPATAPGQVTPQRGTPPAPPQAPGTASIQGRVLTADTGRPLRRAQVRLIPTGAAARIITTDEQGRFELKELRAGRYTMSASKAGYLTLLYGQRRLSDQTRPLEIADRQSLDAIDFRLPRGGAITARVTDELGEPLSGVTVAVHQFRYVQGQRTLTEIRQGGTLTTNDRGERRLFGLEPGDYYISASAGAGGSPQFGSGDRSMTYATTFYPGTALVREAQRVPLGAGEERRVEFSVVVLPTYRISGAIRRSDGSPFVRATLSLRQDTQGARVTQSLVPRPDGSFERANVLAGDYFLDVNTGAGRGGTAPADEYARTPISIRSDMSGIIVTTTKTAVARGKFTFDAPLPGDLRPGTLQIAGTHPTITTMGSLTARTNPDWTVEMTGVSGPVLFRLPVPAQQAGWFLKAVMLDGRDIIDTPIDFDRTKEVTGLEFVVTQKKTTVTGTATDARGTALSDYVAVVFAEDRQRRGPGSRFILAGTADQQGRFTIAGLPPGRYFAAAAPFLERGEEQDPDVLARLEVGAQRMTLGEGESRTIALRVP